MPRTYRNDHEYVKRREALKRKARKHAMPCHLCGKQINWEANWKAPDAFTADHLEAVATGGRMVGPLMPAHRGCNSRRGKKPLEQFLNEQEAKKVEKPTTTRKWYG